MIREDFLLDENGDFPLEDVIINGVQQNTPYGASDMQHMKDIIFYRFGSLKEFPLIGFNIKIYSDSEISTHTIEKNLKIEMAKDKYSVSNGAIVPNNNGGGFFVNTDRIKPVY